MNIKVVALIVVIAFLLFFLKNKFMDLYSLMASLLAKFEGFSAKPYWDVRQWTWGYGTKVPSKYMGPDGKPKPGVTIDKVNAMKDAWVHVQNDKYYLQNLIKLQLSDGQWAALLSFSYNLGQGAADNLVQNINAKKWTALETQWKSYNKVRNSSGQLVPHSWNTKRRIEEWNLFSSSLN